MKQYSTQSRKIWGMFLIYSAYYYGKKIYKCWPSLYAQYHINTV